MRRLYISVILSLLSASRPALADVTDCAHLPRADVEQLICKDPRLSALDRQLAQTLSLARGQAGRGTEKAFGEEQEEWLQERSECLRSKDARGCVAEKYLRRQSELQARYSLFTPTRVASYSCNDNPSLTLYARFYPTAKPSVVLIQGDDGVVLVAESGSTTEYTGEGDRLSIRDDGIDYLAVDEESAAHCHELRVPEIPTMRP